LGKPFAFRSNVSEKTEIPGSFLPASAFDTGIDRKNMGHYRFGRNSFHFFFHLSRRDAFRMLRANATYVYSIDAFFNASRATPRRLISENVLRIGPTSDHRTRAHASATALCK